MKLYGAIKDAVDKLRAIATNIDYPQITERGFLGWLTETLPFLPGIAFGSLTGTGAAIVVGPAVADDVNVVNTALRHFDPKILIVYNETDPGLFLSFSSAAAAMLKLVDGAPPVLTFAVADGLTLGTKRFTVGADADMNAANDVLRYVAIGL